MKHFTYLVAVMVLMLFAVGQTAQGAVLDSCDQWASYCSGSYCVYNAVWGATGNWSQCINASSCTQWTVNATHPGNGIKSYPNSGYIPSTTVGSSISSSVSASPPSGGTYNLSYDVWAPTEVMIWLRWQGAIGPWGSYVTSATIDGRGWDVYKNGYPGYLAQSQMSGGTFNIGAFLQDCVNRGWLSSGATVTPIQCGYEIVEASNTTFTMNSFSVSVGGASTSTTTTAASTTTTAATTTTTAADCLGEGERCTSDSQCCSGDCSRRRCVGGGSTTTTASSTTTTASSTSTTTTASSTSTTSATTTTTSGGGSCDCGTCNWYGSSIPMCCESCSGWGWQDGGCNRSCVCASSCPGGSVP